MTEPVQPQPVAADSTVHKHLPVLLVETMQALSISKDGVYVDATFGRGGHCRAMLAELSDRGRVIALDRDPHAIAVAEKLRTVEPRLQVFQARFAELDTVVAKGLFNLLVGTPDVED